MKNLSLISPTRWLWLAVLVLTGWLAPALATAQTWLWASDVANTPVQTGYFGYGAVTADAAGNTYVTSRFSGSLTLGSFTLNSGPGLALYLARLDASGTYTFATAVASTGLISPRAIDLAPDGTVVVGGGFDGTVSFPGQASMTTAGGTDVFVARFDPTTGTWTQAVRAGGPGNDAVQALVVGIDNVVNVTGGVRSGATFGSLPVLANAGITDAYVARLSAAGQWLQAVSGGGNDVEVGLDLALAPGGDLLITGNTASSPFTFGSTTLANAGGTDVFVARFNPGTGTWTQAVRAGGPGNDDGQGIAVAADGTATVAGSFTGTASFPGTTGATSAGSNDVFVARLASTGTWTQLSRAGGTGTDRAYALRPTASGLLTVVGGFQNTATFGSLPALVSAGGVDVFVAQLDASGTWQREARAGGGSDDQATELVPGSNYITVTGSYNGTASFGPFALSASNSTPQTFVARVRLGLPDLVVSTPVNLPTGGDYGSVTVTGTGTLTLGGTLTVADSLVVLPGGIFGTAGSSTQTCPVVSGTGSFYLHDGATLIICDPAGITLSGATGQVQVTGARRYHPGGKYFYFGNTAQVSGNAMVQGREVLVESGGNGLTLSRGLTIRERLQLNTTLTLGGQPLTLLSDASGTALVANVDFGTVLGNTATVQRFINTAYQGVGYHHYSTPVSGMTVGSLATTGFVPEVSRAAAYNASLAPGLITPFPTVYSYHESRVLNTAITGFSAFDRGWEVPASLAAPLVAGTGYTVHLPGTARVNFTGTLFTGSLDVNLARSTSPDGGWYLLGNPYPSPLDLANLVPSTVGGPPPPNPFENLGTAVYMYTATGPYAGTYSTGVAGLGNPLVVPTGQAFFVRAPLLPAGTPVAFHFNNAFRKTTFDPADNAFGRPTASTPVGRGRQADLRPQLTVSLRDAAGHADPTVVYFAATATAGFDLAADALKLRNPGGMLNLATGTGTDTYAINGQPLPAPGTAAAPLPLTLALPQAGSFTLALDNLLNFGPTQALYLTDAATGTRLDLRQTASYRFTAPAGELTGRFALVFGPSAAAAPAAGVAAVLFPNPAREQATLVVPAAAQPRTVRVLDAMGREKYRAPLPANVVAAVLETAGLAPGVYAVRVGAYTARLVVE